MSKVSFIKGGLFTDERGSISFANDFLFTSIKRFYIISNASTEVIRAWQGHKIEKRWFYCISGSFDIRLVKIDNFENPKANLPVEKFILSEKNPGVLEIPEGYANGFKALEGNSKILVLSNYQLNENKEDLYRYDKDKWTNWSNKLK